MKHKPIRLNIIEGRSFQTKTILNGYDSNGLEQGNVIVPQSQSLLIK
jgi:hypothetical protein